MSDDRDTGTGAAGQAGIGATADREALDWAIRMGDADAADWDAFMAWLEADPSRAGRYDRVAAALRDAEIRVAAIPVASPASRDRDTTARSVVAGRYRWIGGAVAAMLVGAVGLGVWNGRSAPYAIETAAGERRVVPLDDGSTITLAGGSRIRLDRSDPRRATVERGEVLFHVRHDADRPFAVRAGRLDMTDLGTIFDVKAGDGTTRVAVAEGAVMVDPDGAALRLDPGQAVLAEGTRLERRSVEPAEVGGWREGRLAFDGATLDEVAADLSRELAMTVRVAPSVRGHTFRGLLHIERLRRDPRLLGDLLGVTVRQDPDGWTLESKP